MQIYAYDHVGLRVTDAERSLAFYRSLGFEVDEAHSSATALEIVNRSGVRINLIVNGEEPPAKDNVLMDRAQKWPGYTHAAFIVGRLSEVLDWAASAGVPITEGPVDWGRRMTCFLRDPDSNVLEFNELKFEQDGKCRYTLVIGEKNYSSWSMRAWLLLKWLSVPFEERTVSLYRPQSKAAVRAFGGQTGLVPVLLDDGWPIWDTLAIFEHMHEVRPVWPPNGNDRARARSICGEIHSSFYALRSAMPVNTRARGRKADLNAEATADIERVCDIWTELGGRTPWLFGDFSAADIMFAPIATRFQTYGIPLEGTAKSYAERLLSHPLVAEWLELGEKEENVIPGLEVGRKG